MGANTLIVAPDLYANPSHSPIPGARIDYRSITLTTAQVVQSQIIALGILPADAKLMDVILETDTLDASNGLTISVGVLNWYYNQALPGSTNAATASTAAFYNSGGQSDSAVTTELVANQIVISAVATAQTAVTLGVGGRTHATLETTKVIGVESKYDRIIAVELVGAPVTGISGTVGLILMFDQTG